MPCACSIASVWNCVSMPSSNSIETIVFAACGVTAALAGDAGTGPDGVGRRDRERVGRAVGEPGDGAATCSSSPVSIGVWAVAPMYGVIR